MKNIRFIIATVAVALFCLSAQAQDLRAVKDKATGKFGYTQKKSKDWVIEPAFDRAGQFTKEGIALVVVGGKHGIISADGSWLVEPLYDDVDNFNRSGFSILTNKDGRTKYRGAANLAGDIVMPVEYTDIDFDRNNKLIMGQIPCITEDGQDIGNVWGLYDFDGNELAEPQFKSCPLFSSGLAIVTSAFTNLKGVMDMTGKIVVPVENIDVSRSSSEYLALTPDFSIKFYDKAGALYSVDRLPGSVHPYDVKDDDIRAITWHRLGIGEKFYRNNIKLAERKGNSRNFVCTEVPVEWGRGSRRFIRLELEQESGADVPAMEDMVSGRRYTVAAYLYESDGTLVECISEYGFLEAYSEEGILYNTSEGDQWLLMKDINAPYARSMNVSLFDYRAIDHTTVQSAFSLSSSDKSTLASFTRLRDLKYNILKTENAGINSYMPRPSSDARTIAAIRRADAWPMFRSAYAIGNVFTEKMNRDNTVRIMDDKPVAHFHDKIENFSFSQESEEPIYWGPTNNWAIRLELEATGEPLTQKERDALIIDDMFNSKHYFVLAVNLYDEYGEFVRNLGQATRIGFTEDGSVVLDELGLLFTSPRSRIKVGDNVPVLPIPEKTMLSGLRGSDL